MFGGSRPFGTSGTAAPAFGAAAPAAGSAFGAAGTTAFGSTATAAPAFGGATTSLFGSTATTQQPAATGGLFGAPAASAAPAGTTGGLFGSSTSGMTFGSTGSAFSKPAGTTGGFGTTTTTGGFGAPATSTGGGLFGSTATSTAFGAAKPAGGLTFGATGTTGAFGATSAFGATASTAPNGTTVKFEAVAAQDTMVKGGQQTSISTRHQCITCMKVYEDKSIEELRLEDYTANRKGPQAGGVQSTGLGAFGAPANQVAPAASQAGGLFGSTATAANNTLFGAQQNKPLFGAATTTQSTGFGAMGTTGAFGATATSTAGGGLFGAAKPAFGAPAAASTGTAFGFGAPSTTTSTAGGGLFGAPKPFGAAAPQPQAGGMFGQPAASTAGFGTTGFGQTTSTFGTAGAQQQPATGLFGQPAATSQPQSIGLFGAQQQPKPAGFGFGATATSSAAPAFGFGTTTNTGTTAFGATAAKPTGFGAFGTTATSQPSAFGQPAGTTAFGAAQPAGGGLFGAAKPAAPAFGATTQASTGFGGFGTGTGAFGATATSTAGGGGLFGNTAAKPGGLFGATGTGTGAFGATGTGAFGATNTGFGGTSAFGATNTLGGGGGAFGATGTSAFGAPSGGLFGGVGAQPQAAQQAPLAAAAAGNHINDYLSSLTANPYGDDPLYKNLAPTTEDKLKEVLKPTNSLAQKAVMANRYKISPARNIMVKPKSLNASGAAGMSSPGGIGSGRSGGGLFDGLEDEDDTAANKSDLFVPRSSVKKLVLKPKSSGTPNKSNPVTFAQADTTHNITNDEDVLVAASNEESVAFPPLKDKNQGVAASEGTTAATSTPKVIEDSFSDLKTRKKSAGVVTSSSAAKTDTSVVLDTSGLDPNITMGIPGSATGKQSGGDDSGASSGRDDSEVGGADSGGADENKHPAGIVLKRPQYFTVPQLSELASMTDADGNCFVENFVVGRHGYGNIFFPGITNVRGLNLDAIVFFRNKEVIVYPDDSSKPSLGEGLNKKAQVTLDKVWPMDKTKKEPIVSPKKLSDLNYEDKLQRACLKLGAKFVEYRPETGSWVFKVDHFSKYGLDDDSDEENSVIPTTAAGVKEMMNKKLKTGPPVQPQQPALPTGNKMGNITTIASVHAEPVQKSSLNLSKAAAPPGLDPFQQQQIIKDLPDPKLLSNEKVQRMRATLFDSDDDLNDDLEGGVPPPNVDISKLLSMQPSTMGGGVGGPPRHHHQPPPQPNLPKPSQTTTTPKSRPVILEQRPSNDRSLIEDIAHSLLAGNSSVSQGLGGSFAMDFSKTPTFNLMGGGGGGSSLMRASEKKTPKRSFPAYTLQGGYDKYVTLPTAPSKDQRPRTIVPRHTKGLRVPLGESLMKGEFMKNFADAGMFMSRHFRVGWGINGLLANSSGSSAFGEVLGASSEPFSVLIEQQMMTGSGSHAQILSLESWLTVSLDNSQCSLATSDPDTQDIPKFEPVVGLQCLHAHVDEAASQVEEAMDEESAGNENRAEVEENKQVWDLMMALWGKLEGMDGEERGSQLESHEVTMRRRECLSKWLEACVDTTADQCVRAAKSRGNLPAEMLAILSSNRLEKVCDRAQEKGDHYAALMMSVASGSGSTSYTSNLILKYLDLMQELKADVHLDEDRLRLYSTISGTPVWPGSDDKVINTCAGLDWLRALAVTLWFHSSPVASIPDALATFEDAFRGISQFGAYATQPHPQHTSDDDVFDVRYHLVKLYSDRAHPLERIVTPTTHGSGDHLDHRLGWFLARVLESLGYSHMAPQRRDQHHIEFASQLECLGLWHWAVYALLHLSEPKQRKIKVCEALGRHVRLDDEISAEREEFIHQNLQVPLSWIAKAKATRAAFEGRSGDQAWFLIRASEWNAAHEVVVKEIAPDAIIADNYEFFYELLKELEEASESITNWNIRGSVYYDFITIELEVKKLLIERDEASVGYYMERLRPQVTNICSRINSLDTSTARNRLCQAEIAKKVAHLMRAVVSLQQGENNSSSSAAAELAEHLAQLPLPDDYELQELRTLTRMYMKELIQS